jgi:hypothetical protein
LQLGPHSNEPLTEQSPPLDAKPRRDFSLSNTMAYLKNQSQTIDISVEDGGVRYEVNTGWPKIVLPVEMVGAKLEKYAGPR